MSIPKSVSKTTLLAVLGMLIVAASQLAAAPVVVVPPFYYATPTAYEPQISVVNTGIINDMQATVSSDQRYVTINAQPQASTLLALRQFSFASSGNVGFVGGVRFQKAEPEKKAKPAPGQFPVSGAKPSPAATALTAAPSALPAPAHVVNSPVVFTGSNGSEILHQRGMTRIEER